MNKFDLEERLIWFSVRVIELSESLKESFAGLHLGKQIVRSATSSALNYGEAQSAESPKDFIHKMGICLKELRETFINIKIILLYFIMGYFYSTQSPKNDIFQLQSPACV